MTAPDPERTVAIGLIRRGDLFLACQRRPQGVHPLAWEFPGGKRQAGETARQALRRELREELDVDAVIGKGLHRIDDRSVSRYTLLYYHVAAFSGVLRNRVFHDLRWSAAKDLPQLPFLSTALQLIERINQGGLHVPQTRVPRNPATPVP